MVNGNPKKKKVFDRNPADVAAGIDAGSIGIDTKSQRTASQAEIDTFQRTGVGTTEQRDAISKAKQDEANARLKGEEGIGALTSTPFDQVQTQSLEVQGQGEQEQELDFLGLPKDFTQEERENALRDRIITRFNPVPVGVFASLAKSAGGSLAKSAAGQVQRKFASVTGNIAKNSVTAAKTSKWLTGLAKFARDPRTVGSTILGAIGSYPFAGFIRQEALQTIGFATQTAKDSGDITTESEAIELQTEVLNPNMWSKIIAAVPYANGVKELTTFYKAAAVKLKADIFDFNRRKAGILSPTEQKFADRDKAQADRDAKISADLAARDAANDARFGNIEDRRPVFKAGTLVDEEGREIR